MFAYVGWYGNPFNKKLKGQIMASLIYIELFWVANKWICVMNKPLGKAL